MSKKSVKIDLPKVEEKPKRSLDEIKQEYSALCTRSGHIHYEIDAREKDLVLLNEQMRALNLEAAAVQAQELESKRE